MNWKILGPFIAGVVIFLLVPMLPMIMALVSGGGADSPVAANVKAAPPLLNVGNLTGTSWQVKTPEIPIAVVITLNAGGQAIASLPASTPPMMVEMAKKMAGSDTFTGTWTVEGAKLVASVTFQGKEKKVSCDIIGDKIYFKDKDGNNREIQRAQ